MFVGRWGKVNSRLRAFEICCMEAPRIIARFPARIQVNEMKKLLAFILRSTPIVVAFLINWYFVENNFFKNTIQLK